MKKCPYCAELVKLDAIICRYCGKSLDDPRYEYKIYHADHIWTCWWCIPDNTPVYKRPTKEDVKEISWRQGGEEDISKKLENEFAQGWVADYIGPEGLILEERHEPNRAPGADYDSYTTYKITYECQLKRLKQPVEITKEEPIIDSETQYRTAIEKDPYDADAYYDLGILLDQQNRNNEAELIFRELTKIAGNDSQAYYNLGLALSKQEKIKKAEAAFRKAISIDKNDNNAYNQLGVLLLQQHKLSEAEICYKTAIKIDSKDALSYMGLGLVLYAQNNKKGAEDALNNARRLNPKLLLINYWIGVILEAQNQKNDAEIAYQREIKINPNAIRYKLSIITSCQGWTE